jgi:hypothetical protein
MLLAYHPFSPARSTTLTAEPPWWEAFPVVDPQDAASVSPLRLQSHRSSQGELLLDSKRIFIRFRGPHGPKRHRWMGWSFFTGFNDVFFMSLMFFVSGLFVSDSIQRKGVGRFGQLSVRRWIFESGVYTPLTIRPSTD